MRTAIICFALIATAFSAIAQKPTEISLNDLREKHDATNSRYTDVDGVEVHYRDEEQGPIVLLLHASFFNLNTWDQLADSLQENHRVIRLDFPNMGLSGPETKAPPGRKI